MNIEVSRATAAIAVLVSTMGAAAVASEDAAAVARVSAVSYCGARDLFVVASLGVETGQEVGGVSLRNRSAHMCRFGRTPTVRIVWRRHVLPLRATLYRSYEANPGMHRVGALRPRAWAFVPLWWSNWCGPYPWGRFTFRPQLQLRLPHVAGAVTVHFRHPPVVVPPHCDWPNRGSTFQVGYFYSPLPVGWTP